MLKGVYAVELKLLEVEPDHVGKREDSEGTGPSPCALGGALHIIVHDLPQGLQGR